MKDKIIELIRSNQPLTISQIAHEFYITVTEARSYINEAISEKLINFDESSESYYYNFKTSNIFNDLKEV